MGKTIDLGYKYPEESFVECVPGSKDEVRYPTLYIEGLKEGDMESIPKEGKAVITYKKVGYSERDVDGKEKISCDLKVKDITFKESKKEEKEMSDEEAIADGLDKEMEE